MENKKCQLKVFINSYLFSLVILLAVVMLGMAVYLSISWYQDSFMAGKDTLSNGLMYAGIIILLFAALGVAFILESYDIFGTASFYEDELKIKAPFRKTIIMLYDEISHVQIEDNRGSNNQFWIILGQQPIPAQYHHHALKVRFSEKQVRIPYSTKTDQFMEQVLTGNLHEQYSNSKSILNSDN